jgi:hypothetical protein
MGFLNPNARQNGSALININDGVYIDTLTETGRFLTKREVETRLPLKNGIVAGAPGAGRSNLLDTLAFDAINNGNAVVYVCGTGGSQTGVVSSAVSGAFGGGATLLRFGTNTGINMFKGMSTSNLTDYILEIMPSFLATDDNMRNFTIIFLDKVYELLRLARPRKKFSLHNLASYDFNWMRTELQAMAASGGISPAEKVQHDGDVVRISTMFGPQMMLFSAFARQVASSGLSEILSSDTLTFDTATAPNRVLLCLLDGARYPIAAECFLKALLLRAGVDAVDPSRSTTYIFEDCDFSNHRKEFINLLRLAQLKARGGVYFTDASISAWAPAGQAAQGGQVTHPAPYCNAFFVFKQNVAEDRRFWSAVSGATKRVEVTQNQAPMSSVYRLDPKSWTSIIFGNRLVNSGISSHEVDTFQVEEREIDALGEDSCMVIINANGTVYTRRVSWS